MMTNLDAYLDRIREDFAQFQNRSHADALSQKIAQEMIREFNDSIRVVEGKRYLKVVTGSGGQDRVHSFICRQDQGVFKAGDVLKAASWAAPARNFARANLFQGDFSQIRWTGA
jgi:hypothetical protein